MYTTYRSTAHPLQYIVEYQLSVHPTFWCAVHFSVTLELCAQCTQPCPGHHLSQYPVYMDYSNEPQGTMHPMFHGELNC